ncbi:MAG: hypothetical protein RSD77_08990 [Romboutsia sp.]
MSTAICFLITFALILINSIMGIIIGLDYYFTIGWTMTALMSLGLVLFNSRKIFSKPKRVVKNKVNRSKTVAKKPQVSQARRKIS